MLQIYPSEYGIAKMKEENVSGPSELRESPQLRNDDSDDDGIIIGRFFSDIAHIVCGRVCIQYDVCLSVCPSHLSTATAFCGGLLLWAQRAGNIDQLLHGTSAAGVTAF